ncbi:MAG: bifunctional chorismate mutase/prephenate dehydrogenase [Richelia sp. RM2_1_2]|nr:bifunctional chorismate mutase/prephenate dehydrogenase [Richelia sp. SM2_1_7]NJN07991.1 bifunctional chorismate mutase/prephenate dehydrogenase [Richelia sp. RM1_1_1]NJO58054.1 bifunctional chorismate mutase/prephenate dehydrogenase [Richelia sp. RM2_1_2]
MTSNKHNQIEYRRITIIGGWGQMGQFFARELSSFGHQVCAFGNEDWLRADELLCDADLVLISVPIERTVEVIQRAAQYLKPTTAIADITSIKTEPLKAMLEYHKGAVIGLHPMFGPKVKSFAEQIVVVCSGRDDDKFQWLLDFFAAKGSKLVKSTAEEHDKMMVVIQAIRHFARFSLGVFLAEENIDIQRSLLMSSPTYRQEIDILKRLFAQSSHLSADIMLATEERCKTIVSLAETYSSLAKLVQQKDREGLIKEFESAQSFFNQLLDFEEKSEEEQINNYLINNNLNSSEHLHKSKKKGSENILITT